MCQAAWSSPGLDAAGTGCNFAQGVYHAQNTMPTRTMLGAFLYEILEVSPTARPAVIKAAYRCLAQEYHPDKKPGDTEAAARMALINHAYSVLLDPLQRARYDAHIGIGAGERRGRGPAPSQPKPVPGTARSDLRPFAFRPL
jgi:molecular chaperone DnaJ